MTDQHHENPWSYESCVLISEQSKFHDTETDRNHRLPEFVMLIARRTHDRYATRGCCSSSCRTVALEPLQAVSRPAEQPVVGTNETRPTPPDRRREPRYATRDSAIIQDLRTGKRISATVVDASFSWLSTGLVGPAAARHSRGDHHPAAEHSDFGEVRYSLCTLVAQPSNATSGPGIMKPTTAPAGIVTGLAEQPLWTATMALRSELGTAATPHPDPRVCRAPEWTSPGPPTLTRARISCAPKGAG